MKTPLHYIIFLFLFAAIGIWGVLSFQENDGEKIHFPFTKGDGISIHIDETRSGFESIKEQYSRGEGFVNLNSKTPSLTDLEFVSCWLHLPLENRTNEAIEHVLEIDYRWIDLALLYEIHSDGSYTEYRAGEETKITDKPLATNKHAFVISLQANETKEYFLYLRDFYWLNPSLTLWEDKENFLRNARTEEFFVQMYMGLLLGLLIMNLCVYIAFRYRDTLYYMLFLISVALLQAINFNIHFTFVGYGFLSSAAQAVSGINYFLQSGTLALTAGMLLLFSNEFLQIDSLSKSTGKVVRVIAGCFIVLSPVIMFGPGVLLGKSITPIVVAIWATGHILALTLGVYAVIRRQAQSLYFIPALLLLFIVSWRFNSAMLTGEVATSEILMQWLFASCLEMTVFALGLSERFIAVAREKTEAQQKALREAEQRSALQSHYNEQLEDEVRGRTLELNESNEQKNEILRILAHDLKSPIDGVSKLAKLLLNSGVTDRAQLDANAREIERSATYLSELTKNLLDWSQLRSHKNQSEMQPYLIGDLREGAEQVFSTLSQHRSLEFNWESPSNTFAYFDFNAIATVLRNLISNAIKFSEDHTTICVAAVVDKDQVLLTVYDEGCGISPERLQRLQSNQAIESSRDLNGESGMGIGLQICRHILNNHHSTLEIKSRQPHGTACHFCLPRWTNIDAQPSSML